MCNDAQAALRLRALEVSNGSFTARIEKAAERAADLLPRVRAIQAEGASSSQKPVPMHSQLAGLLISWRGQCKFNRDEDWVFASQVRNGQKP